MSEDPRTLWIVATPIGTLGDLSPRAREILGTVDLILAEDTRRARRLLSHLEVSVRGRLQSLHEHNEEQKVPSLLAKLREGRSVALASDAELKLAVADARAAQPAWAATNPQRRARIMSKFVELVNAEKEELDNDAIEELRDDVLEYIDDKVGELGI